MALDTKMFAPKTVGKGDGASYGKGVSANQTPQPNPQDPTVIATTDGTGTPSSLCPAQFGVPVPGPKKL